ncbi:hypothetical protein JCM5350_005208 [Sporobolomyces pararoseus]
MGVDSLSLENQRKKMKAVLRKEGEAVAGGMARNNEQMNSIRDMSAKVGRARLSRDIMSVLDKVQKKQRPLLDLLVDQISSIDQPESTLEETLNSLDSVWMNQTHSTSGLSPLEALINRYPQITLSDLRLFDTLLDRGADLEKVDKGILIRMMEFENEGVDSVAKRFEMELIDKFDELGRVEVPSTATTTEYTQIRFSSPEQSIRAYPSSGLSSQYSLSITQASYRSRPHDDSPLNRRSPSRSPLIDSISPSYNDTISLLNVSEPRSLPPNDRSPTSEQIQISLSLPKGTSISSLYYYLRQVLGARIENITLHTEGQDFFALFEIDKELFESGELEKRIEEMEETKPFVRNGRAWKLTPIEHRSEEYYGYARDEEEEPRFAPLPSFANFARNDAGPSSRRNGCEDHFGDTRRYRGRSRLSRIEDDRRSSSRREQGSPATCGSRRDLSPRTLCSSSRSPTRRRRREDPGLMEELGRFEMRRERDYNSESEEERSSRRRKAHRRSRSSSPAERSCRLSTHRIRSLKPGPLHHSLYSRNQDILFDDNLLFENSIHSTDSAGPSRTTLSASRTLDEHSLDCSRPSFEPSTPPSRGVSESSERLEIGSLAFSQSSQSPQSVKSTFLFENIKLGKHTIGSKDKSEREEQRWNSGGTFESGPRSHWREKNPWREPYRDRDRARYDYTGLEDYY